VFDDNFEIRDDVDILKEMGLVMGKFFTSYRILGNVDNFRIEIILLIGRSSELLYVQVFRKCACLFVSYYHVKKWDVSIEYISRL
jgi:hypothetical protein